MATSKAPVAALLLFLVAASGCIGENNITEGEAEEGWRVVSGPLQKGQQEVQKKAEDLGLELLTRDEPVTATADCDTSGDAEFALSVSIEADGASAMDPKVDFGVDFRDCKALESTANGHLDIGVPPSYARPSGSTGGATGGANSPDAGTMADTGSSDAVDYEGTIDFVGDVDGPCEVDMSVATSAESGQPQYSGTWCGYDASSVIGFSFGG